MHIAPVIGRWFYGIPIVAFGVMHLAYGDFVTRVVPWWPAWIPGRTVWAWAIGAALVACGAALLADWRTSRVATLLGSLLLLSFLAIGVPGAAVSPVLSGEWTVAGKIIALAGGAFLVAHTAFLRGSTEGRAGFDWRRQTLWSFGPWFFGAFLTLCGIQHFIYVEFVTSLVPSWMPGAVFWTYFTGVALIAGGIGVVVPRTAGLAGMMTSGMIFLWVLMLHIPRALSPALPAPNEAVAVFEALAMSGIGLLIALTATQPRGVADTGQVLAGAGRC